MSFQTKHGTVGATVPRVLSSRWHGGCFVSLVLGSDRDETSTPPPPAPTGPPCVQYEAEGVRCCSIT